MTMILLSILQFQFEAKLKNANISLTFYPHFHQTLKVMRERIAILNRMNSIYLMFNKIQAKVALFLLALKNNINDRGITLEECINRLNPLSKDKINRHQFSKLLEEINKNEYIFNYTFLFSQLSFNKGFISVSTIKEYLVKLNRLFKPKLERAGLYDLPQEQQKEGQIKRKVSLEYEKVVKFISDNCHTKTVFDECDINGQNNLGHKKSDDFSIASKIEEKNDGAIQNQIINNTFSKLPFNNIRKDRFFNIVEVYKPFSQKISRRYILQGSPIKIHQRTIYNPEQSYRSIINRKRLENQFSSTKKPKYNPIRQIFKKKQQKKSFEKSLEQNERQMNVPLALKYYRFRVPSTKQMPFVEQLQQMLRNNTIFCDSENPTPKEGLYKYSNQIFENEGYYLIEKHRSNCVTLYDINQGSVGDCYFMASVSSLAYLYPEMISNKFLFQLNPSNYYGVKLFVDGEWRIIKVDDQFPCNQQGPLCAKPKQNKIWAMLLEKAFAKVFGSYAAIQSGNMSESFFALTGAPQQIIYLGELEPKAIIKLIYQAKKKGYIMGTSGNDMLDQMGEEAKQELGLVGNHAYSLLDIHEIIGETVLKLRNPWGRTVWKGAWSFRSKKWIRQLKRHFNYLNDPQDGSFYINMKNYLKYFGTVNICQINPQFVHSSTYINFNRRKSNYIEMSVTTKGIYNIFILQKNQRNFKSKDDTYSNARLILARKNKQNQSISFQYVTSSNTKRQQFCRVQAQLEKGVYIISAKFFWKQDVDRNCYLAVYGERKVSLLLTDRQIAAQFKQEVVASFATIIKEKVEVQQLQTKFEDVFQERLIDCKLGIGFLKTINHSKNDFNCKITFSFKGIKIIKPKKSPYQLRVPAGKEDIIGFFVSTDGCSYSQSIQYL